MQGRITHGATAIFLAKEFSTFFAPSGSLTREKRATVTGVVGSVVNVLLFSIGRHFPYPKKAGKGKVPQTISRDFETLTDIFIYLIALFSVVVMVLPYPLM